MSLRVRSVGADAVAGGLRPQLVDELALLAVAVAAGLGLGRLTTAPLATQVVLPALACMVAGQAVVAVVGRVAGSWTATAAGGASVVLVCTWWFVPGTTLLGIPTAASLHGLGRLLSAAGTAITGQPTPIPAVPGVVMCTAAGAGVATVAARVLAQWGGERRHRSMSLAALVPTAGLLLYTSLLSSEIDRVPAAVGYVVSVVVFLVVVDRRLALAQFALTVGALAVLAPLAVGPALAGMRLDAIPFGAFGGGSGLAPGKGPRHAVDALDLIDDMRAVLTERSEDVMFTASSPVPTYWQVASLTSYHDGKWLPDQATRAAGTVDAPVAAPVLPVLPEATGAPVFATSVSVSSLRSTLLPVPPGTVSVHGVASAVLVPAIGLYLEPPLAPGLIYDTVSRLPPALLISGGAVARKELAAYLSISRQPLAVRSLAHALVRGTSDPLAQALALVRYFTGGRFHYSLAPQPTGGDALETFLFSTRAGFCQQFAGAFAVLARLDGLPTRIAVGFTAGVRDRGGLYEVTGSDAHVWPQVYLGPAAGWVSFEPTPTTTAGTPSAPAVGVVSRQSSLAALEGSKLSSTGPGAQSGQAASHQSAAGSDSGSPGHKAPGKESPGHGGGAGGGPWPWLWGLLAAAGAVSLLAARRRLLDLADGLRSRTFGPRAAVLSAWRRAARDLARRRLGRQPNETLAEHATRLRRGSAPLGEPYAALAELATRADYAGEHLGPADAAAARRLRAEVCSQLRRRRATPGPTDAGPHPYRSATTSRSPTS